MTILEHLEKALTGLEERGLKYSSVWDQLICIKDHLKESKRDKLQAISKKGG